eukprot:XP_011680692.1 PREDICTED: transmembrane protein 114 isoform X2 [Strongylocentrotus purpuratus]
MSVHDTQHGITISLSSVVGYLRRLRRSRRYRRDEKEAERRQMNGRLGRSRDSEDPVLEPQEMPESSGGTGGGGAGINGGAAGGSGGGAGSSGGSNGGGGGGGRDRCPTAIKLFAARYFKFLCGAGVLLGTVSFILSIIAIATDQWLQAELLYEVPNENVNDTQGGNSTIIRGERISTGIWNICFQNFEDGVLNEGCHSINKMLQSLRDDDHITFFQSLGAFEVISTAATFTGCTVAMIAMLHQQPLAMLVAGFTMLFSGLFMLVGHLMMLTAHQETGDMDNVSLVGTLFKDATSSNYGWSFVVAWISFVLCVTAGITDFLVYRNFRKITDELHNTPSRVKYMQRQTPVSIGPTI